MATHGDIGVSQPAASTITMKVRTVTLDLNSTVTHQEVLTIGDGESTLGLARVLGVVPPSTTMGLVVRLASGPSSAADVTVRVNQGVGNSTVGDIWNVNARSSAANLLASVYQSTIADLQATITPLAGSTFRTQPGSTLWASSAGFHFNSSGELQVVTAGSGSTQVSVSVQASWSNVAFSTAGQTTLTTVLSSAATTPYVSGFTAASTAAGPIVCAFTAGSTVIWPFVLWADGGVPHVAQAVGQTGFVFKGQADRPLEFRILSGSTATIYLGVTYKQE